MTVEDLSRSGLRIKQDFPKEISPGDHLALAFKLDDDQQSIVRKEVVVISVKGSSVGAAFLNSEHYDKLGPYLLFHMI
jgi:hypothetical protein